MHHSPTGLVSFDTAPSDGIAITAGFEFDVPARFDSDVLDVTLDIERLGSINFTVMGEEVRWTGDPGDHGLRRMVLHYAHLCAAAGGVDAFLIGSEMRGLTTIRAGANIGPR